MISPDARADVKQQEIKELVAVSYNVLWEALSKLEIKCQAGVCFLFDFGWYWYCPLRTGGGEFYLTDKNPLSVTKFICWSYLKYFIINACFG